MAAKDLSAYAVLLSLIFILASHSLYTGATSHVTGIRAANFLWLCSRTFKREELISRLI